MSELSEKLGIASYRGPNACTVIRLVGPLDGPGGARLIDEAERIDAGPGDRVILHLDDVTSVDDAGIRALLEVEALVTGLKGDFAISVPDPAVREHLERAGLVAARLVVARLDTGDAVRVVATGEIDAASAPLLAAQLDQAIAGGNGVVHVDLSAVTFMDSSGVNALLTANQRKPLHLTAVHPAVERVLEITGVLDMLRHQRFVVTPLS